MEATFDDLRNGGVRALVSSAAAARSLTAEQRSTAHTMCINARGVQGQIDQFLAGGISHEDVLAYIGDWVAATRLVADAYEHAHDLIAANPGTITLHQPSPIVAAVLRRTFP